MAETRIETEENEYYDEEYISDSEIAEDYDFLEEDESILKCQTCEEIFENIKEFTEHVSSLHFDYECNKCNKKFYTNERLKRHLRRAHLPSMNLKCSLCEKIFRTKYNLQQHIYTHSTVPHFKCSFDNCDKQFKHLNSLRQHEAIHLLKNRKECPVCHQFVTRLSVHILSHSKEKQFPCTDCNRTFVTERLLKEHQPIHLGVRFSCDQCTNDYKNYSSLYKHKKAVHDGVVAICPVCNAKFNRKDNMTAHAKKVHNFVVNVKSLLKTGEVICDNEDH